MEEDKMEPPVVVMPELEYNTLVKAYRGASVILEYGCGGSTALAAELPNKTVFSVESDPDWIEHIRRWFIQTPPAPGTTIDLNWEDIGPTKAWGHPVDHAKWRRFSNYPLNIWDKSGFLQPDVVLVDGRFRVGCALATAFRTTRPVTLLFDDYKPRTQYHRVETYIGKPEYYGRMAVFKVKPMPISADRLNEIIKLMTQP